MPYRDGKLKRNDSSMTSSILYPSAPKPSLIHTGLLAGAVAGAPENRPVPVLDDAHELTDNESGGPASIKRLLTSLNCLRPSIIDGHRARSKHGPQPGVIRAGTEDFSCQATAVLSRNVVETIDQYMNDVLVWTCQNTTMKMPALLDTQCVPNLIREDIVQEAGLHIRPYLGLSLSQVDGSYYLPAGQVTTRIRFCGGKRTFKIDFLLAPSNAGYDILLGGPFISKARLLLRNPAGFFLSFARETPQQTAERQRRQQEAQRASEQIERQRAEERRHQREREMAEEQRRQTERDRRLAASSSRRG